jgi:hypothetical protein
MPATFISRKSGGTIAGTIVLWYGLKADIPVGWAYYSSAVGKLIMGATTANTTALGDATHTHAYPSKTGAAGSHGHSPTITIGEPINATTPSYYDPGDDNAYWAGRYHTNHTQSIAVSSAPDHDHSMSETGSAANLPISYGLYYIRKI